MKQTGAVVSVRWADGEEAENLYISFGEYDELTDTDGQGKPDDEIFYYVKGVDMLIKLMLPHAYPNFTVTSYEVVGEDDNGQFTNFARLTQ